MPAGRAGGCRQGQQQASGTSEAGKAAGRAWRVWLRSSLFRLSVYCPICEVGLCKKNALSRLQGRFTPPCATRKQGVEFNIYYDLGQFNLLFC